MLRKILVLTFVFSMLAPSSGYAWSDRAVASLTTGAGINLQVLESDESGVTIDLQVNTYSLVEAASVSDGYDHLELSGTELTSDPGKPQLPVVAALLGVPPGAQVKLSLDPGEARLVGSRFRLPPAPVPVRLEQDLTAGTTQRIEDRAVYASRDPYPGKVAGLGGDAWLRDRRIVRLEIYPFQYVPATGELRLTEHIRVRLDFVHPDLPATHGLDSALGESLFDAGLSTQLLNYDQARSWVASPADHLNAAGSDALTASLPGARYRIPIAEDGLYRLTYATLASAGLDVDTINPSTVAIENQGDQVAIYVSDHGTQGKFEPGDYVAFYGEKFRGDRMAARYTGENEYWYTYWRQLPDGSGEFWKPEMDANMLEKYTDENVYWLTYGNAPGLPMDTLSAVPGTAPTPEVYSETLHMEEDNVWRTFHFTSNETWFWEVLSSSKEISRTYTMNLDLGIKETVVGDFSAFVPQVLRSTDLEAESAGTANASLRGEIVAVANNATNSPDHLVSIYLNDATQSGAPLDQFQWDGSSMFPFETAFDAFLLVDGENAFGLKIHDTPALLSEQMLFDWFEVSFPRKFKARSDVLFFTMDSAGPWKFAIDRYSSDDLGVLEITDPLAPVWLTGWRYTNGTLEFEHATQAGDRFYAGAFRDVPPAGIQYYQPPDLDTPADYIFISHHDLIPGLAPLVAHRASQGLSTLVVDIQDLYNQFNDGIYNPIAIKNFLAYTFANWVSPPAYVLLVGDGHWNFKRSPTYNSPQIFMPPNLSWVDPWQGEVDSLNLLATVAGDDPLPDVFIGRLPVNDLDELAAAVQKTVSYETTPPGSWASRVLFIADNTPDSAGDFPAISDAIIADYIQGTMEPLRIYEDDYACTPGKKCPQVNYAITTTLNTTGTLIANYTGHASLNRWAHESVLVNSDIAGLSNGAQLPVVLSMTCLDGYWLHPGLAGSSSQGLIEDLVRADSAGAVAAFSPTGLGVATGHEALHRGFYDSLFVDGNWILGQAALSAKVRLFGTGSNLDLLHTFTIFGDPALQIAMPTGPVEGFSVFLPLMNAQGSFTSTP